MIQNSKLNVEKRHFVPVMIRLLFLLVSLIIVSCYEKKQDPKVNVETQKTKLDIDPGIQDITLGSDVSKFEERISFTDTSVVTNKILIHHIRLLKPITEGCFGAYKNVSVNSYNGKIFAIWTNLYCPDLIAIFKNKFGEYNKVGDSYNWLGNQKKCVIKPSGDTYKHTYDDYHIEFFDQAIFNQYEDENGKSCSSPLIDWNKILQIESSKFVVYGKIQEVDDRRKIVHTKRGRKGRSNPYHKKARNFLCNLLQLEREI